MSHIEYFGQDAASSIEYNIARLEVAVDSYMQLVYGEPAELDSSLSLSDRIAAVADVIEGLA